MDTVSLSFRYSENDYVRAMRAHYATRLRVPLDIAVVIGAAALGAYFLYSGLHWPGIVLMCLSGILALLLIAAFAVIPHIVFRRELKFRDENSLIFSPKGIHFRREHIDSELQWSLYSRVLIDKHSFLLYYGSQSFTIIPTRVFQTAVQRETFERLLAQNVPKVVRKDREPHQVSIAAA
jgi:hypothetical protein